MNWKSLREFLLTGALTLIGAIVGILIGGLLYDVLLPLWTVTSTKLALDDAVDILFVDYRYLAAVNLESNTLYIRGQSGNVYSVSQNNQQLLSPLPNRQTISEIWLREFTVDAPIVALTTQGEIYQESNGRWELLQNYIEPFEGFAPISCASDWYLPVLGVVDSAGVVFAHALANEYICYVLFKGGRLQIWTRTQDAFTLMETVAITAVIGLIAGFKALSMIRYFKSRISKGSLSAK